MDAAEDFLGLVSGADMVKFAKNGSDATTAALKLARAATGRETVAVADQPFFSTDDWFIGNTPMNAGIPDAVRAGTVGFTYNDLGSLRALFDAHPGRIAAVFMEAATALHEPAPGFLEGVREMCTAEGTVLVFDEMITGFRWSAHGAHGVDLCGSSRPTAARTAGHLCTPRTRPSPRRATRSSPRPCSASLADVVGHHPACLVFRTQSASGRPWQGCGRCPRRAAAPGRPAAVVHHIRG